MSSSTNSQISKKEDTLEEKLMFHVQNITYKYRLKNILYKANMKVYKGDVISICSEDANITKHVFYSLLSDLPKLNISK